MVQIKIKRLLLAAGFGLSLISCEKLMFNEDQGSMSPQSNFDYLWKECNEKYSYFELKGIDWDLIKEQYSARISEDMSEDSLFAVLGGMLRELKDDHSNLISDFNISYFGVEYLGQSNFDFRVISDNYIGQQHFISGPFRHNFIDNGEIAYIRYSSFSNIIDENSLDYVLEKYADTKGLVFDIRDNGGGYISNVYTILSRFIEEEHSLGYSRIKTGTPHDDFSEAEEIKLTPHSGVRFTKPVIILTDRGSYSSSSIFSLCSKEIDNLTLIGDTTGGGLGMPNGGQLPNGWAYRFSITQTLTSDLNEAYENGVPPDETVLFDWNDLSRDEILDRAIQLLQ